MGVLKAKPSRKFSYFWQDILIFSGNFGQRTFVDFVTLKMGGTELPEFFQLLGAPILLTPPSKKAKKQGGQNDCQVSRVELH